MDNEGRFAPLLGQAAIHLWAELPRDVQEKLFEHAVVIGHKGERDESLARAARQIPARSPQAHADCLTRAPR